MQQISNFATTNILRSSKSAFQSGTDDMANIKLYYGTNRRHSGKDKWNPTGYGADLSLSGMENLRFGAVTLPYDDLEAQKHLHKTLSYGVGDGSGLSKYLYKKRRNAKIEAFRETLDVHETDSDETKLGSSRTFAELQAAMNNGCDVLVFVHGFNVSWWEAVASAMSLQLLLNEKNPSKQVLIFLYTWPSDGKQIPYWSYFSDRADAESSGAAIGRGFLKLRDYLMKARRIARSNDEDYCHQSIHLLCHSMGNYVLQNALRRTEEFSAGGKPPRLFDQVFLCAADVDDDVFEKDKGLRRLPEMAETVTIYHNRGDLSMPVSDHTKGNSDRLGLRGANRPADLDARIHQVDCSEIVSGLVEHSYYQRGRVNMDIRQSIDGIMPDDTTVRSREPKRHGWPNVWRMT